MSIALVRLWPLLLLCGCHQVLTAGQGPIDAPKETWSFVEVPGTACADGSATGFGINPSSDGTTLAIYFQGGGACWDGDSCYGLVQTAVNVQTGYGAAQFDGEPNLTGIPLLDRGNDGNPFKGAQLAFVPYCTGDLHAGDRVAMLTEAGVTHATHFSGGHDAQLDLAALAQTFPQVTQVWLTGSSAGGFATLLNLDRARAAFPDARVDVIDDSGPPLDVTAARFPTQRDAWGLALPSGCADCSQSPATWLPFIAQSHPDTRIGLLSYARDPVISAFSDASEDDFAKSLVALLPQLAATPNQRAFVVAGDNHVVLQNTGSTTQGVSVSEWLAREVNGTADWQNQSP